MVNKIYKVSELSHFADSIAATSIVACCTSKINELSKPNATGSVETVSHIIGATKETGLIKTDESESSSTRYAGYLPFWA